MKKFYLIALIACANNAVHCEEQPKTNQEVSSSVLQVLQQENERLTKEVQSANSFRTFKNICFFGAGCVVGVTVTAIVMVLMLQQVIITEQQRTPSLRYY